MKKDLANFSNDFNFFTVTLGCGETTSENCSYMINPGTISAGECRLRVCPCSEHICQIRLDFSAFVLNQPDTSMYYCLCMHFYLYEYGLSF